MAAETKMEPEALRELLGAHQEPVRGQRAVLGGRAGTVMARAERNASEYIQIRWEDDGTLRNGIKVSELDHDDAPQNISVTEDAFATACRKDPERTAAWFETLRLPLVEDRRGCLDELCACLV